MNVGSNEGRLAIDLDRLEALVLAPGIRNGIVDRPVVEADFSQLQSKLRILFTREDLQESSRPLFL